MLQVLSYFFLTTFIPRRNIAKWSAETSKKAMVWEMVAMLLLLFAVDQWAEYNPSNRISSEEWMAYFAGRFVRMVLFYALFSYVLGAILKRNHLEGVSTYKLFQLALLTGPLGYVILWHSSWFAIPFPYSLLVKVLLAIWWLAIWVVGIHTLTGLRAWRSIMILLATYLITLMVIWTFFPGTYLY